MSSSAKADDELHHTVPVNFTVATSDAPLARDMVLIVPGAAREGACGAYFVAPKRLSNELDDMIGAEPAT